MDKLSDNFNRNFYYLRLSITDYCNFRCQYCLPNGCDKGKRQFLKIHEIDNICAAFSELGVNKIRLTGGEPTLRKDFSEIAQHISAIPSITKRVFTTNGYRLKRYAAEYIDAGLNGINISVDSLNAELFSKITGHDKLPLVLEGIQEARRVGFKTVKINVVLLKGYNASEIDVFLNWAATDDITIRFLELMRTGTNEDYFNKHHLSSNFIKQKLLDSGWLMQSRDRDAGPAIEFEHPNYAGKIGIIAPYSKDFCRSCNRLRISSDGQLHLCLFGQFGYSLRKLMQDPQQRDLLKVTIQNLLVKKEISHHLIEGNFGGTPHLASIGG